MPARPAGWPAEQEETVGCSCALRVVTYSTRDAALACTSLLERPDADKFLPFRRLSVGATSVAMLLLSSKHGGIATEVAPTSKSAGGFDPFDAAQAARQQVAAGRAVAAVFD